MDEDEQAIIEDEEETKDIKIDDENNQEEGGILYSKTNENDWKKEYNSVEKELR